MSTKQAQIRNYVRAAIIAATGLPAEKVFRSVKSSIPVELMPCISIYSLGDSALSLDDDHQKIHTRQFSFVVDVMTSGSSSEDASDALAIKIRQAVLADDTFAQLVHRTTWTGQEWGVSEGSPTIAGTALTFTSTYEWDPDETN